MPKFYARRNPSFLKTHMGCWKVVAQNNRHGTGMPLPRDLDQTPPYKNGLGN